MLCSMRRWGVAFAHRQMWMSIAHEVGAEGRLAGHGLRCVLFGGKGLDCLLRL